MSTDDSVMEAIGFGRDYVSSDVTGYHTHLMKKGVLGEISKIREELDELIDAHEQKARILALCEVADLVGAIELYLTRHLPGFTIADAQQMVAMTRAHKINEQR